jgi:hypothetical protein
MSNDRLSPIKMALSDVNLFSDRLVHIPLLSYQRPVADGICRMVMSGNGGIITVEMPRQSGKNQISATCEVFLLLAHYMKGGSIVKTAPTYQPQLAISKNRLISILDRCELTKKRWKTQDGNSIALGRAREVFLSAQPGANVVGATADIALFVDEAQEIDIEKFERDFSPMRAWKNSPTIVFGVRWDGNSFFERLIETNLEYEKIHGVRRHFRVEPDHVTAVNPSYKRHFDQEVARLGKDHILIKTQYLLESVSALGDLFSPAQIQSMRGDFNRIPKPSSGYRYFIGIDIGGEQSGLENHDDTILTVAQKSNRNDDEILIVNCYRWKGANWEKLHKEISLLLDSWRPSGVVVDGRGIGNATSMWIREHYKYGGVEVYQAVSSTVTQDGYILMSMAELGKIKVFSDDGKLSSDGLVSAEEIFSQLGNAKRELGQSGQMRFYVPEKYGHDDILKSVAYAVRASRNSDKRYENILLEAVTVD